MEKTMERTMVNVNAAAETMPAGLTERQIYNRLQKIADLEKQIKALTAARDEIRAEILSGAECVFINCDKFTLDAGRENYAAFDSKAFKAAEPDLYKAYTKQGSRSKFRYKFK